MANQYDWASLFGGARQTGQQGWNEQGNPQGYDQWSAQDPTMGEVAIVDQDGQRIANWFQDGKQWEVQLDGNNQQVGQPHEVKHDSFLKSLAPVAALAGAWAAPWLLSGIGGAGAGMGADLGGAAGEILGGSAAGYTPGMGLIGSGGGLAGTALGTATEPVSSLFGAGGTGGALSGVGSAGGVLSGAGGLLKDLAPVLGAVAGAASSQDQEQTSTREPWGPAQDWIKQNISRGQELQKQYTDKPFSDQQQTAYNNVGGLLNTLNSQMPGLLGGFNANASGANNFDRANPRKQLTGSSFNPAAFQAGLLNFFPR